MALAAGKPVPWVADQLGHSSPVLTLKTYAHAIRGEEGNLDFTDLALGDRSKRPYAAQDRNADAINDNAPDLSGRGHSLNMEHETGLAGACRFAAGALR
jgi:hypothetical protein